MTARTQTIMFLGANHSGSHGEILLTLRQGNVFDSVHGPGPRLTIVFGHVGYKEMGASWRQLCDSNPSLKGIDNPFDGDVSPLATRLGHLAVVRARRDQQRDD